MQESELLGTLPIEDPTADDVVDLQPVGDRIFVKVGCGTLQAHCSRARCSCYRAGYLVTCFDEQLVLGYVRTIGSVLLNRFSIVYCCVLVSIMRVHMLTSVAVEAIRSKVCHE